MQEYDYAEYWRGYRKATFQPKKETKMVIQYWKENCNMTIPSNQQYVKGLYDGLNKKH